MQDLSMSVLRILIDVYILPSDLGIDASISAGMERLDDYIYTLVSRCRVLVSRCRVSWMSSTI